jgi:hypothetical protein
MVLLDLLRWYGFSYSDQFTTRLTSARQTGQLVAEYPFIYLMSKFPLTKLVGVTV